MNTRTNYRYKPVEQPILFKVENLIDFLLLQKLEHVTFSLFQLHPKTCLYELKVQWKGLVYVLKHIESLSN